MSTSWHPLFVYLLRPLIENFYEVKTALEVGDAPRQADLVLLRRTHRSPSFHSIWRHLTTWNILEYKVPSVSARLEHVDLLVELGLGIERRLNELARKEKQRPTPAGEVSYWYLAHNIGRRFLKRVIDRLKTLKLESAGIWSSSILQRPMFLVSIKDLPVDEESLAFHILHGDPTDKALTALRLSVSQPPLWNMYSQVFEALHPDRWQEIKAMARQSKKGPILHFKEMAEHHGIKTFIKELGKRVIIENIGEKEFIEEIGAEKVIEEIGTEKVIEQIGKDKVIEQIGAEDVIDRVFSFMDESERAALKRRLHEAKKKKK